MLKEDHRKVESLFKRFEKAGDRAFSLKRTVVDGIIGELSKHAAIEEELFYPVTRATVPGVEEMVRESIEEHHIVKWVLSELQHMDSREESFDAKVAVLIENVRHHVKEEETDYFPRVRRELGRKTLLELGDAMETAKATAPTRPHPRAPSTPPNITVSNAAGVIDRVEDKVSGLATEGAAALRGVADRISGVTSKACAKQPRGAADWHKRTTSRATKPTDKIAKAADEGSSTARKLANPASKRRPSPKGRRVAVKAN